MRRWLSHGNVPVADVCCVALIVTVLTASFLPIFTSLRKFPEYPSANDWFKECAFNRSAREAIVRHHQFPLRSQYLGGGYPLLAYPEDSSLSPLFLTTLLFGENVGLKVRAFLKLLVGGLGMYYLLRAGLSCPPGAAVIGALLLALSGWFHHKTGVGYLGCQNYYFLPLLMALVLQAAQGRRSVVLPSLIFAVMLVDGKFVVPASLLFLLAWGMLELVQVRRGGIVLRFGFLRTLAAVACAGSLVAMVKVLPMLTLLQANPRVVSYAALGRWWRAYATVFYQPGELWTALVGPGGPKQGEMSLGWVPLVLAALSIVRHPRSVWRWALLLALSAWLCMGYWAPVDLWRLLWHWPVFGSINKPALWMNFLIVLPLCVLAASLFRQAPRSRRTRAVYGAYLCVGAVGTALLLHNAYRLNASSFTRLLEVRPRAGPFYSVTGNGKHYTYQNMLQNVGSIDWDGDILLPEHAVPRLIYGPDGVARHNESYRDEVWLARGNGRVRLKRFTPNAIDLDVECQGAGTVVVNQNFHPGWRSSEGEVLSHEGLLAIGKLPARGRRTVRLRYVPVPFYVGLAVSLLTLAVVARIGMRRIRAVGLRECLAGTAPPAGRKAPGVQIAYGSWSIRKRAAVAVAACAGLGVLVALAVPPLRADYALRTAELIRMDEQTERAAELCETVLSRYPDSLLARAVLAACYYDEERFQEAVQQFEMAAQLGTPRLYDYARWARAHHRLGQLAEAEQVYRQAIAAYPGRREPRQELAVFLLRTGAGEHQE